MKNDVTQVHFRKRKTLDVLLQGFFLMAFWLLLSWQLDLYHIVVGFVSTVVVVALNHRVFRVQFFKGDVPEWERMRPIGILRYIPWLVLEIVLASLQVAYVVLHPKMPIRPLLLRFTAKLPNIGATVVLANSITLTPGTITIEVKNDRYLVHALRDESITGLTDGTMQTQVAKIFRKSVQNIVSNVKISRTAGKVYNA